MLKISDVLLSDNVAELLDEATLQQIGRDCVHEFELDKTSREDWERRTEKALKLALQVLEEKSFPWPNASNVKFPLITIAALQYHARSYPALIRGTNVVKCRVVGDDESGKLSTRANRVERHMSYQILEEDENWEDQMDKVLITQPIVGCAFKKIYYDPIKQHNISENIFAKDLVVSYYTKSLETAPRISHVIYLSSNDIYERVQAGLYREVDLLINRQPPADTLQLAQDKAQGISPAQEDKDKPFELIEQHRWLDLDEDGYKEPYIVVVHKDSKEVLRIVARFLPTGVKYKGNTVIKIDAENFFTKYPFIPSPDGGFYDLGFGALLGPLNESINTLINQLIDAGTMANTAGGFLARGIKVRSGTTSFQPNEWKPVESTGDDLRKGIMPLPVREPSQVLFTLLSLLINYGERIGGAVDIMVGENPGQNTPAETSRTMAEQGMKIFSGIFKRTYRGLKEEFRKLYRLNQLHLDGKVKFGETEITSEDYVGDPSDIRPAADPNMVSDSQRLLQSQHLIQIANPALGYNMYEVHKRLLEAYGIEEIEKVLPNPKGPNAPKPFVPPKVQETQMKEQTKLKKIESDTQIKMAELQMEAQLNQAKIDKLQAEALLALEQADSEQSKVQIAAINAQIGAAKTKQEHLLKTIEMLHDISLSAKEKSEGG